MTRRLITFTMLAALAAFPAASEEMTLEQVLEAHYEAIGGLETWDSWATARMTGTMSMGGGQMEAPYTMTFSNGYPGKSRLEFTVQGMTGTMAFDGETAWAISPFMGSTTPQPMPPDQAKNWKEQSDFAGPLVHPDKKGVTIELLGLEETEGTETYKLKVTMDSGDVRYYYLDSEAFLPIKVEAKTTMQGQEIEVETSYGDYKEVNGRMFAHSFESRGKGQPEGSGQTITVDAVEFDVELEEGYFAMPEAEEPAEETEEAAEGA